MALNLTAVRRLAFEAGLSETYHNPESRVVSFASTADRSLSARINVYWTTGTVATCLPHPRQGKTQLFRRNVTLSTLREIFSNPRVHTGMGYHRHVRQRREQCSVCLDRSSTVVLACGHDALCATCANQLPRVAGRVRCPLCRAESSLSQQPTPASLRSSGAAHGAAASSDEPGSEEEEVERELERMLREHRAVQESITSLQAILADARRERETAARRQSEMRAAEAAQAALRLAQERARRERIERQRLEAARTAELAIARALRGTHCDYFVCQPEVVESIFSEKTTCVALGDSATLMIDEDGSQFWTTGLPRQLYNKLNGRQKTLPRPRYCSMGSENRYYVDFKDGTAQWGGAVSERFSTLIRESSKRVSSVAFGESCSSYFVVFQDGSYEYTPEYVPEALCNLIESRSRRADVKYVSLGPEGEWFLSAKNGRMWWGGISVKCSNAIRPIKGRISSLHFGGDGMYFIRFE